MAYQEKLRADIKEFGWHVLMIPGDEEGPAFAYSVGFYESFKRPEILILGLDVHLMHRMINHIGDEIRKGMRFIEGKRYPEIIEGFDCLFVPVKRRFVSSYLAQSLYHYRGYRFDVLQCLWPDKNGHFPGEADCAAGLVHRQELVRSPFLQRLQVNWRMLI